MIHLLAINHTDNVWRFAITEDGTDGRPRGVVVLQRDAPTEPSGWLTVLEVAPDPDEIRGVRWGTYGVTTTDGTVQALLETIDAYLLHAAQAAVSS